MGGKRSGTRQCLYVHLAVVILLAASACAPLTAAFCGPVSQSRLPSLQALINAGDFEEATMKSEELISVPSKTARQDEGLFALGLIHAHADNPRKDYRRSRDHFARLVKEYPGSPLAGESKIWIGVLDMIEKTKQVDIEIESKKKVNVK